MNPYRIVVVVVCVLLSATITAQDVYKRAISFYPLSSRIGYRSNLGKKSFTDIKVGMTFSTLPFVQFEWNKCWRYVRTNRVNLYYGVGITFDSFIPGGQIPLGIEVQPIESVNRLSLIAEVNPKITFGPTNLLNTNLQSHIGVAYYLK